MYQTSTNESLYLISRENKEKCQDRLFFAFNIPSLVKLLYPAYHILNSMILFFNFNTNHVELIIFPYQVFFVNVNSGLKLRRSGVNISLFNIRD